MGIQRFDEQSGLLNDVSTIHNHGDGSLGPKALFGSLTTPLRIDALWARNQDSVDHTLSFNIADGGPPAWDVVVPAGAGVGSAPPKDCFAPLAAITNFDGLVFPPQSGFWSTIDAHPTDDPGTVSIWAIGGFLPGGYGF
jgi:hypothetical protein